MRWGCVYTLQLVPRVKPTSVMPAARAKSTANEVGAETETSMAIRAVAAFCTISKLGRPLIASNTASLRSGPRAPL